MAEIAMAINELATIRALIASKSSITALTSTRIWVGDVPPNVAAVWKTPDAVQPSILINVDGGDSEEVPDVVSQPSILVTIFGPTMASAASLAATFHDQLNLVAPADHNSTRVGTFYEQQPFAGGIDAQTGWNFVEGTWRALLID